MDGTNQNQNHTQTQVQPTLPYIVGLNLLNLPKPINDPIQHDVIWPFMQTKYPFDIPKFEGGPIQSYHVISPLVFIKSYQI
jgi:hypothetical protein